MPARFGTDGIRGTANVDLTVELCIAIGRATAEILSAPAFVVGRDTRLSGSMLQAALAAGLTSAGANVIDVGVLPTPGVAYLCAQRGVPGAVVSASHNPFDDNGIKLFGNNGTKLSVETEAAIEAEIDAVLVGAGGTRSVGNAIGEISIDMTGADRYRLFLGNLIGTRRLDGLRVVLDCGNGAASAIAPRVFEMLGAHVTAIFCEPDGRNINEACGSTDPGVLSRRVLTEHADLGLAFDGDADRLIAVDHEGSIVDGDALLALFTVDLAEREALDHNMVVVTVMTNLGFRLAMADRGIEVQETSVGDRHVLAALDAGDLALGGEQSGHIIFRNHASTGDGILTGVFLADLVVRSRRTMYDLSHGLVERVPQVLVNVPVTDPGRLFDLPEIWAMARSIEAELGGNGRVLLRPSGTEPVVRVMVEALTETLATSAVDRLRLAVEEAFAVSPTAPPSQAR